MNIIVNRRHIHQGIRDSSLYCPVAIALNDSTSLRASINQTLILADERLRVVHKQPMSIDVLNHIQQFDETGEMEPFTFEIDYENQSNPS